MPTVTEPILLDSTGQQIKTILEEVSIMPQIVDNLSTADATKALSAKQGKILDDSKMGIKPYSSKNFNDYITAGVYSIGNLSEFSNSPSVSRNSSWGNLLVLRGDNTDTIKQIYYSYNSTNHAERQGSGIGSSSTNWGSWEDYGKEIASLTRSYNNTYFYQFDYAHYVVKNGIAQVCIDFVPRADLNAYTDLLSVPLPFAPVVNFYTNIIRANGYDGTVTPIAFFNDSGQILIINASSNFTYFMTACYPCVYL